MRMDEEHWRPFEGRYRDGMPLVGAVSRLSANETQSIEFPWCIHLTVHCDAVDERRLSDAGRGRVGRGIHRRAAGAAARTPAA